MRLMRPIVSYTLPFYLLKSRLLVGEGLQANRCFRSIRILTNFPALLSRVPVVPERPRERDLRRILLHRVASLLFNVIEAKCWRLASATKVVRSRRIYSVVPTLWTYRSCKRRQQQNCQRSQNGWKCSKIRAAHTASVLTSKLARASHPHELVKLGSTTASAAGAGGMLSQALGQV